MFTYISFPDGFTLGVSTDRGIVDVDLALSHLGGELDIPVTIDELVRGGYDAKFKLERFVSKAIQEENTELHGFGRNHRLHWDLS